MHILYFRVEYKYFTLHSKYMINAILKKNEHILCISLSRNTTGLIDALHQLAPCFMHQPAPALSRGRQLTHNFSFKGVCDFEGEEFIYHYA